jgi:16S rRNA (adenine1518-N6/adenine1519-N6)-dimethyltransferase
MPIRQTQSYLRGLFVERGIAPQRRLGQNFLIDLNIHSLSVNSATIGRDDLVLEVGSGTGALTSLMAGKAATVVAVDVDPAMARLTTEAVAGFENVRVLNCDALAGKHTLNPHLVRAVDDLRGARPDLRLKIVANLPYQIATPVISNFLVHPELTPELMVVTVQRELAERLCAQPGSAAYGAVSVVVQALADVSIVRFLPPSVFWPPPKVDSAVIAIRANPAKRTAVGDVGWFHALVRKVFLHRRKYLRHALAGIWRDSWTKADVDKWLEAQGYSGQLRAERLDFDEFRELSAALRERWGGAFGDASAAVADDEEEEGQATALG